jgi:NADPH:quinone reductase-like Zn-dependent oxidoreductase
LGVGPEQLADKSVNATAIMADPNAERLNRLAEEIVAGRLRVPIQRTYALSEASQAFADFGSGTLGKLAISID